jgi:hypothetical protein
MDRPSPKNFVKAIANRVKRGTWLDKIPKEDRDYFNGVVDCLIAMGPQAELYPVADALIKELGLTSHRSTVVRSLREAIDAKA